MCSYLSVINESTCPVISVLINDVTFFKDVLLESAWKYCPAGSSNILVLDNREKTLFDLYIAINPRRRYILRVLTDECILIQSAFL